MKGHNNARGWCDFSTLERIAVTLGEDQTPPVTTCTLTGDMEGDIYTSPVMVTLTATDESGVSYTKYRLDDGSWITYISPFMVSTNGNHTVRFYSVDIVGNTEQEKSCNFTIQREIPNVTITITGGIGVSAAIKNTGETTLTNLNWSITLDGALIFIGKTKSGTIPSLAPGETVTVKDFVIGLGKTGIEVNVEAAQVTATGTILLFFVMGVK